MSEILALTRCAIQRHRTLAIVMLAVLLVGQTLALFVALLLPAGDRESICAVISAMSLFPPAICALVLFDYGQEKDLALTQSGCSDWLLRMPIASWKIAVVPVVLKTLWVAGFLIIFFLTAPMLGIDQAMIPLSGVCFSFAGGLIWILWIAWRPVRTRWSRVILLGIAAPTLYFLLIGVVITGQADQQHWRPLATIVSVVVYAIGAWMVVRAVAFARSSIAGNIPESGRADAVVAGSDYRRREFSSPVRALVWHDLLRTSQHLRYALILGVMPTILIATFFVPLHLATLLILMYLFSCCSGVSIHGIYDNSHQKIAPAMATYLATSPLGTAAIAWTRLLMVVCIALAINACVLLVFVGWSFGAENREIWYRWATEQAIAADAPTDVMSIGFRWSIAIVLGAILLLTSLLASTLWVGMMGRAWLNSAAIFVLSFLLLLLGGVLLRWFLQQTNWESTTESFYRACSYLPALVIGLLIVKAISMVGATMTLGRSKLAAADRIIGIWLIWAALVVAIAAALAGLIPDQRVTFLWCLAVTALVIPAAGVLILPVSVNLDRHR